jgi:hypothetical protein
MMRETRKQPPRGILNISELALSSVSWGIFYGDDHALMVVH